MTERVLTIRGNQATRPITDFALLARGLGNVFYVDSNNGSDTQSGKTPERAVATLDYAIGLCTANQGDVIYALPGHAETVASAAAINADVAGISIIGLGEGADRPTFTFSATVATITVTAASILIKNILIKPSIDSVVSPIVVSAADCTIDVEIQDASATVECVCGVLTTAAAERLTLYLKYRGFLAGNACVNAVRLVGVDTARVYVDFYGVASTAVVEFHTTSCHDIDITGLFYNNGTTLTKNVVDTVGSSTWSVRGWDGNSNAQFSGGDNAAMATDDVTAIATAVATVDGLHDVPTADASPNLYIRDVVGNKTDAAVGAVATSKTVMAYAKGILEDTGTTIPATIATAQADLDILTGATGANLLTATQASIDAIEVDTGTTIPALHAVTAAADATANVNMRDVVGRKDDAAVGTVAADKSLVGYAKGILTDTGTTLPATMAAMPQCVVKADGACLAGLDPLFTVAGGPIRCKIVGLVTTVIGANVANFRLQHITTTPAATVELNVGAVAVTDDAAGTFYRNLGATSIFTPSAGLGFDLVDPVTIEETEFLLAPGVVQCLGSAANTGVIAWYMTYTPLSPSSVVTAAA